MHGVVVSVHLLYSIVCTILQSLRCHICLYLQTPQSDSHSFLSCSSLSLFRNAIYAHSTLLYEVRSKSPSSPTYLYASVESASCLAYKLYLVTCKRFSVFWLSKSNHVSIPVWFVFWITVRSDIDHQFTCLLCAQFCVQPRKVQGYFNSYEHRHDEEGQHCPDLSCLAKPLIWRRLAYLVVGQLIEFTSTHWHKSTFIKDYFWKLFVCCRMSPFRVCIILVWQVELLIDVICWQGYGT